MSKCEVDILIRRAGGLSNSWYKCQLEKDHKGKHRFEGKSEGKLYKIEWWNKLAIIEGLTELYVEENAIEKEYKK